MSCACARRETERTFSLKNGEKLVDMYKADGMTTFVHESRRQNTLCVCVHADATLHHENNVSLGVCPSLYHVSLPIVSIVRCVLAA